MTWSVAEDAIVEQAIGHGLVDGAVLYTDSMHLKANANRTVSTRRAAALVHALDDLTGYVSVPNGM
jgi:hypothetical protein